MNWTTLLTYQIVLVIGWLIGLKTFKWYMYNNPKEFYKNFLEKFADEFEEDSND